MQLKNKVTVITGGNSGIGFGIATAFKNEGAVGAITGRKQATLDHCVAELGGQFIGINADVTNMEDLTRIFRETADQFGLIDSIVVNAGGAIEGVAMKSVASSEEADFDHYMHLNLKSVYFTMQKALPYLKDGASIVLIGSIAGHRAFPGQSTYAAAKAAVLAFARGFSLDLLDRKIRVNVVSPGTIDTPAFDKFLPAEQVAPVKGLWTNLIPAGRIGQPSDIGNAAVYLASDASSFVMGTEIIVDGGVLGMTMLK